MIRNVWIINRYTGATLLNRSFVPTEVDQDLFGGLISAIFSFAKEIGASSLKRLDMGDMEMVYLASEQIICALSINKNTAEDFANEILKKINEEFKLHFGTLMRNWDGSLDHFTSFVSVVDRIVTAKLEQNTLKLQKIVTQTKEISRQISKIKSLEEISNFKDQLNSLKKESNQISYTDYDRFKEETWINEHYIRQYKESKEIRQIVKDAFLSADLRLLMARRKIQKTRSESK
ncbi:MAG: hypothetical protein ACFFC7_10600 [Candidatus Hermodarchaeota archaeon]